MAGAVITNVYVDGFNLYYGCLKGSPYKWLDLLALCRRLLPHDTINRIRYFTAVVSVSPTDPRPNTSQQAYLRALRTIPCLSVHFGHFLTHATRMPVVAPLLGGPKTVEVIKTEEKGSDVNLATHLLLDGCKGDCAAAVVITNDSDLKEPVELAQSHLGLTVGVINPHPARTRSRVLRPTFFRQLRPSHLRLSQFPAVISNGSSVIHKPTTW
jgi:NYN domain-containing protein